MWRLTVLLFLLSACAEPPGLSELHGQILLPGKGQPPAGARLRLVLEDASRQDVSAAVLAELHQQLPPLNFRLQYNPQSLQPGRSYRLRARVESADGQLLWITDGAQPLPAPGEPLSLPLVAAHRPASVLFFLCGDQGLQVSFDGDQAVLQLEDHRRLNLPRTVSASGSHYQSEAGDFWLKDDTARLTLTGEASLQCVMQSQLRRWAEPA